MGLIALLNNQYANYEDLEMTQILTFPGLERALTLVMFALYMITSIKLCRYSSWVAAGEPNPFLPGHRETISTRRVVTRVMEKDLSDFRVY